MFTSYNNISLEQDEQKSKIVESAIVISYTSNWSNKSTANSEQIEAIAYNLVGEFPHLLDIKIYYFICVALF